MSKRDKDSALHAYHEIDPGVRSELAGIDEGPVGKRAEADLALERATNNQARSGVRSDDDPTPHFKPPISLATFANRWRLARGLDFRHNPISPLDAEKLAAKIRAQAFAQAEETP